MTLQRWIKFKKLETQNILNDEKKIYKDLIIYFTRYVNSQSIKMLSLHYHELLGKIEKHKGKKIFDICFFILGGVLDKIK